MSIQTNDIPEGFKLTEVGQLPEECELTRLGDTCSITTGKKDVNQGDPLGKYPFFSCAQHVSRSNTYSFDCEAILIAGNGDVGSIKYYDGKFEAYQRTYVLHDFLQNAKYLSFYLYGNIKKELVLRKSGSTMPYIRKGDLTNFVLTLPPLPEQKAIVQVLSTIQKAIEAQDKIIAATSELKKSLMRHLFTYGPVPVAEAENVPLKETEIGPVPEHWDVVRLGEIADIKYGKAKPKTEGNVPVVGSGGIYSRTDSPLIDSPTLVIGRKGTAGEVWLFEEPSWPSDTTFYLVWKQEINIHYIFSFLSTHKLSGEHAKTTLPSLQKHELEKSLLPIAPILEQQEIANILSSVDRKIEVEQKRKAVLQTLFQTMLHLLMTGKVRVKELEDIAA